MIIVREKIEDKEVDPLPFERPLSENYRLSKKWSQELPDSLGMSLSGFPFMNRTEEASHSVLGFCDLTTGVMRVFSPRMHKRQAEESLTDANSFWGRALQSRFIKRTGVSFSKIRLQRAEPLLRDLGAMLKEEDEPDFLHRPTKYAYDLTEKLIKDSYTHYVGSAPLPTFAPDGEGGVFVEWRAADESIVRLIIPANQNGKHYIYSKDLKCSQIDYSVSGLAIAQQLRSAFTD